MERAGVYMSRKDEFTFWGIEDYRAGKVTRKDAAAILGVSEKTVTRKAKRVRENGLAGLAHGNRGKQPANALADALREQVLALVRERYFDFNLTHTLELLKTHHAITVSYGTLHGWCRKAGVGRGKKKRRTSRARVHRERMANEGLLLQMDGSHHCWNGKDKWCLIAMIDDATSDIPWAEFFPGETTVACLTVLRRVIEKRGIPDIIYTDEAGWADKSGKREQFSQFKRACEELGIRLMTTRSPEAKGRIERAWRTFQDRLVPELRLAGIRGMTDANRYVEQAFLPAYWRARLTVLPTNPTSRYRPLPAHLTLDNIICLKYARQVSSDHTVGFETIRYRVVDMRFGSLRGTYVTVIRREDGGIEIYHGHLRLKVEEIVPRRKSWEREPA